MTDLDSKKSSSAGFSKADRRRIRNAAERLTPRADVTYPPGPYLDGDGLTDAGKEVIRMAVLAGNVIPAHVAHLLGMTVRNFNKNIRDEASEFFEIWEKANAALDSAALRENTYRWTVLHDPEALKFHLRVRGYSEKSAPTVQVDAGPRIQFVLPAAYDSIEADMKAHGQTEILDARSPTAVAENERLLAAARGLPAPKGEPLPTLGATENESESKVYPAPVLPPLRSDDSRRR